MRVFASLFLLALATPALASDGVLEIGQTCAVQTGCFAGDSPGFPVTISASGSYRLTGNLAAPDATDGIFVTGQARSVTLDLGGFEISCATPPCSPGSGFVGSGIKAETSSSLAQRQLSVRNGSISRFGLQGIISGGNLSLEVTHVAILGTGDAGIATGTHCVLMNNRIISPGNAAISVDANCHIAGNVIIGAGSGILSVDGNSVIRENTVQSTSGDGISCSPDCSVSGNRSFNNGSRGIVADGSVVESNVVRQNGSDGIVANSSLVRANLSSNNTGFGLRGNTNTGYSDNAFNNNNGGNANVQVSGSPNQIGSNVCGADTTCP